MKSIKWTVLAAVLCLSVGIVGSAPLRAEEVKASFDFAIESWLNLESEDGPVELHRIRLTRQKGRLSKATLARPHNQAYLENIGIQVEYTNEADRKWKARLTVRWIDADGTVIDGLTATETLDKKAARKIMSFSAPTLRYGLDNATKLEVDINYEP